jgi:hypothetical protein
MAETLSSIDQFSYRPELIQAGTVYHYVKSNIDGSYPARIVIYISNHDHLEVLKFEAHGMDAAYITARMDWETFSADRLESWVLTPDGQSAPQASLSSSSEDGRRRMDEIHGSRSQEVEIKITCVYTASHDFRYP